MNLNITVDLSKPELEKIIKDAVEKACPGYRATTVTFEVSQGWDFRGEPTGAIFNKAVIRMSPITKVV